MFTTGGGYRARRRNVSWWFAGVVETSGAGGSLHSLRNTALTRLAVAGVHLSIVSREAGHESITTTIDLYGQVPENAVRDAVAATSAGLGL